QEPAASRAAGVAQKVAPVSSSSTRRDGGRPMNTGTCPLCQQSFPVVELYAHIVRAEDDLRWYAYKVIATNYPRWVELDGACGPCWRHSIELERLVKVMEELA